VRHLTGGVRHLAERGCGLQPGLDVRVDQATQQGVRPGVVAQQTVHRSREVGHHLVEGAVPGVARVDAVPGDQQVLRGGAHLAAVEGERQGQVGEHALVVVGGVDQHRRLLVLRNSV
jgi:hypothetical protein